MKNIPASLLLLLFHLFEGTCVVLIGAVNREGGWEGGDLATAGTVKTIRSEHVNGSSVLTFTDSDERNDDGLSILGLAFFCVGSETQVAFTIDVKSLFFQRIWADIRSKCMSKSFPTLFEATVHLRDVKCTMVPEYCSGVR